MQRLLLLQPAVRQCKSDTRRLLRCDSSPAAAAYAVQALPGYVWRCLKTMNLGPTGEGSCPQPSHLVLLQLALGPCESGSHVHLSSAVLPSAASLQLLRHAPTQRSAKGTAVGNLCASIHLLGPLKRQLPVCQQEHHCWIVYASRLCGPSVHRADHSCWGSPLSVRGIAWHLDVGLHGHC